MSLISLAGAVFAAILLFAYSCLLPPRRFPKQLPTIPFYVSLLPFFKTVDQSETYRRYLEKPLAEHGAVKIFFGARWNILITRPDYVAEMFKDEDTYAKCGNQKKIPNSVLAEYTGDNIISSHGANWRLYQSILKPGLQKNFEFDCIRSNALALLRLLRSEREASASGGVVVPPLFQRYTLANLSQVLLCTDFETLEKPDAPLHTLQLAVKREIFKPVFLNFPFLDDFPIPSRNRVRKLVRVFTDELCRNVCSSPNNLDLGKAEGAVSTRMIAARRSGKLSEKQFRHNLVSVFLAGHENPQLHLVSTMYLLGKHQDAQERLRVEVQSLGDDDSRFEKAQDLPFLTSVLYEVLRLFPPISQLLNRRTSRDVCLGGRIPIAAGTYVGYNAYATGRNKQAWGLDADEFRPERWGTTMEAINSRYRQANARAEFISFHGGRRACLGQRFALHQIRITLIILITNLKWRIDPTWPEMMTPAGPLYAKQLQLLLEDL